MTTPRAVLDAGQRERERYWIDCAGRYSNVWRRNPDTTGCPVLEVFRGTRAECQDFISDRVFRAMKAAEEKLKSATDDWVASGALNAGDDQ